MMTSKYYALSLVLLIGIWTGHATVAYCAEEKGAASHDDAAAQANNPLAGAFPFFRVIEKLT